MSFKEYFKLLLEMPAPIKTLDGSLSAGRSSFINAPIDKTKSATKVDQVNIYGDVFDVYQHNVTGNWIKYFFMKNGERMAMYTGYVYGDDIVTGVTETRKGAYPGKSMLVEIYLQFLLKKYRSVVSDSGLTPDGFNFWKRNFGVFIEKGYQINLVSFDMNTEKIDFIEKIKSAKDLDDFYTDSAQDYRFQIYRP